MTRTTDNKRCLVNATSPYQLVFRVGSCLFRVFFNILSPVVEVLCSVFFDGNLFSLDIIKYDLRAYRMWFTYTYAYIMIVACWFWIGSVSQRERVFGEALSNYKTNTRLPHGQTCFRVPCAYPTYVSSDSTATRPHRTRDPATL